MNQREAAARKAKRLEQTAKKYAWLFSVVAEGLETEVNSCRRRRASDLPLGKFDKNQNYSSLLPTRLRVTVRRGRKSEPLFRQRRKIMLVLLRRKSADCSPLDQAGPPSSGDAIGDHPSVDGSMNTRIAMSFSSAPWIPSGLRTLNGQTTHGSGGEKRRYSRRLARSELVRLQFSVG